jgi:hypothetical protein
MIRLAVAFALYALRRRKAMLERGAVGPFDIQVSLRIDKTVVAIEALEELGL